jgi:hypothetical protein
MVEFSYQTIEVMNCEPDRLFRLEKTRIMRNLHTVFIKFFGCSIFVCASFYSTSAQIAGRTGLPAIFAAGVVSTPFIDAAVSFTADGKTVYFCQGTKYLTICCSQLINGKWCRPVVLPFSGQWKDWDPFFSPDGKKLFFVSNRPLSDTSKITNSHLWYSNYLGNNKWSQARLVIGDFNTDGNDNYAPTVSNNQSIYFCSMDRDGHKGMASFYAAWLGDHYGKPIYLPLNGSAETMDPFISPDEHFILFNSGNDLYITYRNKEQWSAAQKLGSEINNGDPNSNPYLSRDGKTLYYTSGRIKGFYVRKNNSAPLNYSQLQAEMNNIFNGRPNILMVPFHLQQPIN